VSSSGIEGVVTLGPIAPVTQPEPRGDEPDEYRPYEATILFRDAATQREVASVRSGADGTFLIELPPGRYIVEPTSRNQFVPPYASQQNVTVHEGEFTTIEIVYDTGIR